MAEPVREQIQNLNLSAQDSGCAETNGIEGEVEQEYVNIMADTDSPNLQQDPSIKHATNGGTNMEVNKGDNYEDKMYMDDSGDEDEDDFEYSKYGNSEQRVPVSFGDENAFNEHRDNIGETGASQFDGFQPFFPQGYQEEITPESQGQDSGQILDNSASSQGQGQISDICEPPVSNQAMLLDLDQQNEIVGSQPANMQETNPFMDTQSSDMYSNNPFLADLGRSDGAEIQQVVPEASVEDESGSRVSQTPDLILMGESCPPATHDSEASSSLSEISGFEKAQNVIPSIAQESDTTPDNDNVPLSEVSSKVPEVAICDDLSGSPQGQDEYDSDEQESFEQKGESLDQENKIEESDFQSQNPEFQSAGQELPSQDQELQIASQEQDFHSHVDEFQSHDQEFQSCDQVVPPQDQEFQSQDQEIQSHDQEIQSHDQVISPQDQEFQSQDQEIQSHDQEIQSHEQEMALQDQEHEQEFENQAQEPDILASAQKMSDLNDENEKIKDFEEAERDIISHGLISKQIESPEEDMTERCMGLIEPTQIVPEEEIPQDPLEMAGANSDMDHMFSSSDGFPQDAKMDGSITMEGSHGFETGDQMLNDVCKTPVDVSSSDQSSASQPQMDMRESGMSGSFILESGETLDDHPDEYPNDVSKSLTQGSSDEGEADDLNEQDSGLDTGIPNQMSRSAMEDSIILDDGETFDDQPQLRNEMTGSMIEESGVIDQKMESEVIPPQESIPSAMEGSSLLEENQKIDEVPVGMSSSLIDDSMPAQSSEPSYELDDHNVENDYVPPQNGAPLHQGIPDIHYQSYDSQSGEIIETSGEVIDTQGEDYVDDISSEESQDHLETSQRLAEEVSEHKDFTHRHPSELEVGQKDIDQGYFEQKEELDTPGEIDENELYGHHEHEHEIHGQDQGFLEHDIPQAPADMSEPGVPADLMQVAQEPCSNDLIDVDQFKQVCEPPQQEYPIDNVLNEQTLVQESVTQSQEIPSELISEPKEAQIGSFEPEPEVQALSQVITKELVEKENLETVSSEKEEVKSENISEISKVSEVKDSTSKELPKKKEVVKTTEKKKEEKSKMKTSESVMKKETSSKVTQKTISKPKSAPPKADAQKIPSPTKTSTPRPASTTARKSPPKSAEPTKSRTTTSSTGGKTERPASGPASMTRRPVSVDITVKKNAIPLRKSLPAKDEKKSPVSPTKRETTSPTKKETAPKLPPRPRTAPTQPRPKKDASSDSGVEEDKSTRKTTTVTQKKKVGGVTVTQKTTTTTVKKTETKNGPTTDSRKSSAGTRTGVASKIGSMDNARHSPGGGNVKITTKKTDYSTVGSRIGSKANLEHKPGGGEKKILTQKLEWKTSSRIGSLDNAKHSPGGGNVKITNEKVEWRTQSKIGSLDNAKHSPGGGNVKIKNEKLQWDAKSKCGSMDNAHHVAGGGDVKILHEKIEWKVTSKCGSLDNTHHMPGGGHIKILSEKLTWKNDSRVGSLENASHIPGGGNVKIESKKLEFDKVQSKVGSKDNIKHHAGGGDKRIETVKVDFREKASSKVGSKDNLGHTPKGGEKKIETQKLSFREKAKPRTDTGASPVPNAKSPPPENGVQEEATAAQ